MDGWMGCLIGWVGSLVGWFTLHFSFCLSFLEKVRSLMVSMILGTDMANHKSDLDELNDCLTNKQKQGESSAWLEGEGGAGSRAVVLKVCLFFCG